MPEIVKSYQIPEVAVRLLRNAGAEAATDRDRATRSNARSLDMLSAVAATAGVPMDCSIQFDVETGLIIATKKPPADGVPNGSI